MLEGFFGLMGLLLIDTINGHGFKLKPKNEDFRRIDAYNVAVNSLIVAITIFLIQFLSIFIPMTVSNWELGLAIIFASVCEELFFRGVIVGVSKRFTKELKLDRYKIIGKFLTLSALELVGIVVSAIFFSLIHINYYESPEVLVGLFIGGIALGILYVKMDDLTPLIFGHLFLNIYTVIRILGVGGLWASV
jgi:membrane protease YdiL (CAAX protease family)